jgi:ATP-dependent protease HslVU (ClpYQ) peptidase subunit
MMTTIAAFQGPSWAVIGFDSRVTEGSRVITLPDNAGKVFESGPYLLGAAGDMRAVNLLAHTFKPPVPAANEVGSKLDRFMSTKFVPALKACFDEAQYGEKGSQDSTVLAVIRGKVYEIGTNYEWCHEQEGLYSMGSGSDYALGAMYAMRDGRKKSITTARHVVRKAVEIAAKLDPETGTPVRVVSQKAE